MNRRGWARRLGLLAALLTADAVNSLASAQRAATNAKSSAKNGDTAHEKSLDMWLVSRFRGAQLLADSSSDTPSVAAESSLPRVEGTRDGRGADTLFALHSGARLGTPVLGNAVSVQLAGPTGTITPLSARVIARRAFRAPRRPGAPVNDAAAWRYGWSYLIVLPRGTRETPAARYRGWLLLSAADASLTKRSKPAAR